MSYAHVYLLTNLPTGKQYVGISRCTAAKRFKNHCNEARKGSTVFLHRSIRKHGKDAFAVTVLEDVDTWAKAQELERVYIAHYGTFSPAGYNMTRGGEGTVDYKHTDTAKGVMSQKRMGKVLSAETRQRMSDTHKITPKTPEHWANILAALARRGPMTDEHKANMRAGRDKVDGPLSEGHKKKLSDALRGRKQDSAVVAARTPLIRAGMTLTARQKISASNSRRGCSEKTREKMSVSLRAALADPKVRAKMSASNATRVWTDESKAKIGAAHRGVPKSPEQRELMRQSAIKAWVIRRQSKESRTA
jgi:group I intron endonuclease